MKRIFIVLLIVLLTELAYSQSVTFQSPFKACYLKNENNEVICFSVCHETNIRYYVLKAGVDSTKMETVLLIRSLGNTVSARDYTCDIAPFDYNYYRIAQVDMNGNITYSSLVNRALDISQERRIVKKESNKAIPLEFKNQFSKKFSLSEAGATPLWPSLKESSSVDEHRF